MDVKVAARMTHDLLLGRELSRIENCPVECSEFHVTGMLIKIEDGEVSGEKAHRWLGWAQGVIVCRGGATLDDMKQINKAA